MNRVPYRRVTPPRNIDTQPSNNTYGSRSKSNYANKLENPRHTTFIENFATQLVISALLLAIVLVISLVNISPFIVMRENLNHILAGSNTPNELMVKVRLFNENWLGVSQPTLYSTPASDNDLTIPPQNETPVFLPTSHDIQNRVTPPPASANGGTKYDVIENMTTYDEYLPTAYDLPENPHTPGPLVTPGLWD